MKRKSNKIRLLLKLLLISLIICVCSAPGQANAKEKKTIKVGYVESTNFMQGMSDAEYKSGYAYEYLQKVAYYTGWEYEYVYGDWSTIFGMLKSGEVDLMAGISYTDERSEKMNFPDMPMGTENYYIYVWSNSDISVEKPEDLKNRKIGCTEDSMQEADLREWNQENGDLCDIVTYSGNDAMYHAFIAHEIDAVVDTDNAIEPTNGVLPVVKVGSSDYYLAVAKNRADVYEELNDALALIGAQNPYFTLELQQKYFSETAIRSVLTGNEREWLKENPVITIGYVEDYAPFCITSEAGTAHGMMIDIIDRIWQDLDIPPKKEYRSYKTYEELVEALHKEEVDIVLPVYENEWYSEKDGIIESTVISSFGVDMVYEDEYISSDEDVIAIAANSPIQSKYVSLFFPENPQLICDTQDDCIKAVKSGKAKGVLINPYRAGSVLKNNSNLKVMQLTDGVSVCMGTRKEDTQLISILNRGILLYGEKNITHSLLHHTDESYEISFTTYISEHWVLFFVLVVCVFLIIIGAAISIIITINDSRKKMIQNEKKMEEQLEILHSLSEIYTYMNLIDFENEKVICFNADELRIDSDLMAGEIRTEVNKKLANQIESEHKEQFMKFTDITTLKQRLENKKMISDEFININTGWFRAQYISLDESASKVIYTIQNIEEEKQREEWLIRISYTDELTRLSNRKAYEDDLKKYQENMLADDFVYISMDINGLKTVNDTLGHSAGDELIKGAAECMNRCFGAYGNVYRTGGDEFIAMIFADEKRLEELERDFERTTGEWSGEKIEEIAISYGYATKKEKPDMTVLQMAEVADKRMYEAKSNYYIHKGIDRRR